MFLFFFFLCATVSGRLWPLTSLLHSSILCAFSRRLPTLILKSCSRSCNRIIRDSTRLLFPSMAPCNSFICILSTLILSPWSSQAKPSLDLINFTISSFLSISSISLLFLFFVLHPLSNGHIFSLTLSFQKFVEHSSADGIVHES